MLDVEVEVGARLLSFRRSLIVRGRLERDNVFIAQNLCMEGAVESDHLAAEPI